MMTTHMPRESQYVGCLIGQCLGDSLGFVIEGAAPAIAHRYVEKVLRAGEAWTQQNRDLCCAFSRGQYSDDSQLARELMQSLVDCHSFDPVDYAARIATIFREDRIVGFGKATESAARRLIEGVSWDEAGTPSPNAGNGSAMRAAPIGLFFFDDYERLIQSAHDQGRITHSDPRCSAGAIAIAGAVALVLQSTSWNRQQFLAQLSEWVNPFDPILADAIIHLNEWATVEPSEAIQHIAVLGTTSHHSDDRWRGISPFVTTSVVWSLYSFVRSPDEYWETICTAIGVGGDIDTTAAMAGAISGARLGIEHIPAHYAAHVNDLHSWGYTELVQLAQSCYTLAMEGRHR